MKVHKVADCLKNSSILDFACCFRSRKLMAKAGFCPLSSEAVQKVYPLDFQRFVTLNPCCASLKLRDSEEGKALKIKLPLGRGNTDFQQ